MSGSSTGTSALEIVERMREGSFTPGADLMEYMEGVARRAAILDGLVISTHSVEAFVADLARVGLLKDEEKGP